MKGTFAIRISKFGNRSCFSNKFNGMADATAQPREVWKVNYFVGVRNTLSDETNFNHIGNLRGRLRVLIVDGFLR
jgi:hypothetical protein